jgi:hypothetical protein
MQAQDTALSPALPNGGCQVQDLSVPELVAQVYEAAPPAERAHLLETLLRPLGVLSLFGIADGVFARVKLQGGWQNLQVRLEDIQGVRAADVVALVEHAQQACVEAVEGLAQLLAASPALSGTAAAALLISLLLRRERQHPPPRSMAAQPWVGDAS